MNIEDIKIGETYNIRAKCIRIDEDGFYGFNTETKPSIFRLFNKKDVETSVFPLPAPENGIKNTETAPKYDPCRLLKKGDRVQVKRRNGRCNGKAGEYLREAFCTVAEDETQNELVRVLHNATEYRLDPAYLELVTPVEEMEPYSVEEDSQYWHVFYEQNGGIMTVCKFLKSYHPTAKAAAEAERDRLNAEYRKEAK